jgi:excinuclease ABC subunit A
VARGTNECRLTVTYKALVKHFRVDEDVPFADLPDEFKKALYFGTNGQPIKMSFGDNEEKNAGKPFEGLVPQMQRLYEETQSEFTRHRIRAFMAREPCKICGGARLKPEVLAVTIKDRHQRELNIHQSKRTSDRSSRTVYSGSRPARAAQIIGGSGARIQSHLQFLIEGGLSYLA